MWLEDRDQYCRDVSALLQRYHLFGIFDPLHASTPPAYRDTAPPLYASHMHAVKSVELGRAVFVDDAPVPSVRDGYVLIKTSHVALNPSDWKHVDYPVLFKPGHTLGFDASGTIIEVGTDGNSALEKGERVAGPSWCSRAGSPADGAFGEYSLLRSHLTLRIPEYYSDAQAASLPVACLTAFFALYETFNFPWPDTIASASTDSTTVLIYGGSSASGLLAIQLAKLSGLRVITTCSPHNFDKVRRAGAALAFDYHDGPLCASEMYTATGGKLVYAMDCIADTTSPKICAGALTREPHRACYASLLPVESFPRNDVDCRPIFVFPAWGEDVSVGGNVVFPAQPEVAARAGRFMRVIERLLRAKEITTFESQRPGGLKGVVDGLYELRKGRVSGAKLVYRVL